MPHYGELTDRIRKLEEELEQVRKSQAEMQRTLEAMRDALLRRGEREALLQKRLANKVAQLEQATVQTSNLLREMLGSRIWKTLQAGGGLMLNAVNLARGKKNSASPPMRLSEEERQHHIQLRCDTLPAEPKDPVAGKIEIRGWAMAPEGIEGVEIRVGTGAAFDARYGIARHDIAPLFPKMRDALHSGFLASFDTRDVPDGIYQVSIRVKGRGGQHRVIHAPLIVNQETGHLSEYHRWLGTFEVREPEVIHLHMAGFRYRPKVSVLVPIYQTNPAILQETIDSVRAQSYENWELCLVDDGSERAELTALLERNAAGDSRIRIAAGERGGISAASNHALSMASGEYVALLDHDDLLAEDALFYMVMELQRSPVPELLYSDEDHIDEAGRRFSPFFKPDWSPDLILSENYICHLMMFRRDLAMRVGGFRSEFDLSQDHDILLRMSAAVVQIVHVPRVLYHWRTSLDSMKRASNTGDGGISSSCGVVLSALAGQGTVEPGVYPGRWRVRYRIPEGSKVSILIPTAGKTEVLGRNLESLWKTAGHRDFEVVVIDNSGGEAVVRLVDALIRKGKPVRRFDCRGEAFNYSKLNNQAAGSCETPLLLFLNDDTEGISEGWLTAMVELAMRPEVGAVGAKLLYPDGRIQHAGVTMGLAEICGHSFKGLGGAARHYYDFPDLIRNVSALTAACLMVRGDVFRQVGGFDEGMFPIAYNDIDMTLKIGAAGYRVLYTPHALLYHYEAYSKSDQQMHPHPAETLALKTKWKDVIARDPFYNPNLTRRIEDWSLGWE